MRLARRPKTSLLFVSSFLLLIVSSPRSTAQRQDDLSRTKPSTPVIDAPGWQCSLPGQIDDETLNSLEYSIRLGRFEEVEAALRTYLRGNPISARAHYDLGYVLFRVHKIDESIRELSKSLELNIRNADAHKILGLNLMIIGKEKLAEVELLQAVGLAPDSAESHYYLGRHYMTGHVFLSAKGEFETAISLDRFYMKAYDNLGLTLEALGDNQGALKNYSKAVELEEQQGLKSEWPYLDLARFYSGQHDAERAFLYLQKAIEENPRADQAHFELAKIFRDRAELQQAVDALRKAIAINPYGEEYYYVLAQVYRKQGKMDESRNALKKFLELRNSTTSDQIGSAASGPVKSQGEDHP